MDLDDFKIYLTAKLDQLAMACEAGDSDGAVTVINSIAADGHPEMADAIMRNLIARGLRKMAGRIDNADGM